MYSYKVVTTTSARNMEKVKALGADAVFDVRILTNGRLVK